jgi:hypothetical protein
MPVTQIPNLIAPFFPTDAGNQLGPGNANDGKDGGALFTQTWGVRKRWPNWTPKALNITSVREL